MANGVWFRPSPDACGSEGFRYSPAARRHRNQKAACGETAGGFETVSFIVQRYLSLAGLAATYSSKS
jgi:hypothetical protein